MATITIPRKISEKDNDLIAIPRREYEILKGAFEALKERQITEKDILRWSKEAKELKKEGKLSVLFSLKDFR